MEGLFNKNFKKLFSQEYRSSSRLLLGILGILVYQGIGMYTSISGYRYVY